MAKFDNYLPPKYSFNFAKIIERPNVFSFLFVFTYMNILRKYTY